MSPTTSGGTHAPWWAAWAVGFLDFGRTQSRRLRCHFRVGKSLLTTLSGVSNPVEAEANGNNGLTNTGGQYKFSWASPNSAGCYVLSIAVIDGSTITANFDLR